MKRHDDVETAVCAVGQTPFAVSLSHTHTHSSLCVWPLCTCQNIEGWKRVGADKTGHRWQKDSSSPDAQMPLSPLVKLAFWKHSGNLRNLLDPRGEEGEGMSRLEKCCAWVTTASLASVQQPPPPAASVSPASLALSHLLTL